MNESFLASLLEAIAAVVGEFEGTSAPAESSLSPAWAQLGMVPSAYPPDEGKGIAAIRDADPAFDLAEFLVHVGEMFEAYHDALDRGDLAPVRRFVDETTFAKLQPKAKSLRRIDGPRALHIRDIRPITAKHLDGLDTIHVFITAEQPDTPELLCEYWELVRKHGTVTKPGLTITKCPNCGGPVDGLDPSRCAYCGTRLADPALDWVARKITPQ